MASIKEIGKKVKRRKPLSQPQLVWDWDLIELDLLEIKIVTALVYFVSSQFPIAYLIKSMSLEHYSNSVFTICIIIAASIRPATNSVRHYDSFNSHSRLKEKSRSMLLHQDNLYVFYNNNSTLFLMCKVWFSLQNIWASL